MPTFNSTVGLSGTLATKKIKAPRPPLSWQLRQWIRKDRILGLLGRNLGMGLSKTFGVITIHGRLRAVLIRADGTMINYGVVSRRLVTTALAEFVVDQLIAETAVFGDFKHHDSGVGITGAAITDTDIETTDGESRAVGTQVEASSKVYESVGTITYTSTLAITEHGLFNASTGVTLMDRHTFAAINVVNTDSIQFTYDFTVSDGG